MASAVPIVVGVQGRAAGGGLSLTLLGDVLVLGRSGLGTAAYTVIGPRMAACPGRCRAVWLRLTCWHSVGDKATLEYGRLI